MPADGPALRAGDKGLVQLTGDGPTLALLNDGRLRGETLEVLGEFESNGWFRVGPIHSKSLWVTREGRRFSVSYWCAVCSIRTYSPGKCWCCQEETELELLKAEAP